MPALAGSSAACRSSSPASYLSLPTVWAFIAYATTTPAADFCCTVKVNRSTFSHDSVTCNRSPEVSSIAFHAQPPDLPPVPLMDMGFAILCPLARHRRPQIQFLSISSRVCSALLSDLASRRRPCASLTLLFHQDGVEDFNLQAIEPARHTTKSVPVRRFTGTLSAWAIEGTLVHHSDVMRAARKRQARARRLRQPPNLPHPAMLAHHHPLAQVVEHRGAHLRRRIDRF